MRAKELMIGDWVECVDSTHKKKVYAQIDAIEEGQTCILVKLDNCNWFLDISFIKPIPLTPEILEKNGFVPKFSDNCLTEYLIYKDIVDGLHKMYIKIFYFRTKEEEHKLECFDCATGGCHIWIKYIHQLQHALRLCGIEKTIEL